MSTIKASTRAYERWLKAQIGPDFVTADLAEKHRKMKADTFSFLRATYWRWSEIILQICPELADAPQVLAVGDTHLENFGTWRDKEGRQIWGVNDFDDAAVMPYPLDLVRLAASAILADEKNGPTARAICESLLAGYTSGLDAPSPFVLERDHKWLRKAVLLPEPGRADFWAKYQSLKPSTAPRRYRKALIAALPGKDASLVIAPRTAGTGSLGRPRFVARMDWEGGPVLREAKAVVVSAWSLHHNPRATAIRAMEIAKSRFRAPDPRYRLSDGIIVRRLSPNSRKIQVEDAGSELVSPAMLEAMGREIANCHAGQVDRRARIRADLKRRPDSWLRDAAKAAARAVAQEYSEFS